jgi:hypothetical protein
MHQFPMMMVITTAKKPRSSIPGMRNTRQAHISLLDLSIWIIFVILMTNASPLYIGNACSQVKSEEMKVNATTAT